MTIRGSQRMGALFGVSMGVQWLARRLDPFVKMAYSQEGEDLILGRMFENVRTGFYVDVGAHHPYRFSNTCAFYKRGWRGLNVDADPSAIREFRRHRARDINVCCGIGERSGSLSFHVFNDPALNTFDVTLAAERARLPGYHIVDRMTVGVRTLSDVLAEYLPRGQSIDFMSIDVEGLDLEVLKSNDWHRFRPRVLLVEARALSIDGFETDPTLKFARSVGYDAVAKTVNTVIFRAAE